VTGFTVSLELCRAVASAVGVTGKPQLVFCSRHLSHSKVLLSVIEWRLFHLHQNLLTLNEKCWSYSKM